MSKYEDFTEYIYRGRKEKNTINIGWIEGTTNIRRGNVSDEFLNNLWEYIKCPIHPTRGIYTNKALDKTEGWFKACYNGYEILLGDAEIRVIDDRRNQVYAAPNLILHYIITHQYVPPDPFVEAVIYGSKPGTEKYSKLIQDIYSDANFREGGICPFCTSGTYYFLPHMKKNHADDSKIQIQNNKIDGAIETKYDAYIYRFLCKKCGRIFRMEYSEFKEKFNLKNKKRDF